MPKPRSCLHCRVALQHSSTPSSSFGASELARPSRYVRESKFRATHLHFFRASDLVSASAPHFREKVLDNTTRNEAQQ